MQLFTDLYKLFPVGISHQYIITKPERKFEHSVKSSVFQYDNNKQFTFILPLISCEKMLSNPANDATICKKC